MSSSLQDMQPPQKQPLDSVEQVRRTSGHGDSQGDRMEHITYPSDGEGIMRPSDPTRNPSLDSRGSQTSIGGTAGTNERPRISSRMSSYSSAHGSINGHGNGNSNSNLYNHGPGSSSSHTYTHTHPRISPLPPPNAPLPLPPDQISISSRASTLSMSVRIPSRIPQSADRKSSLPPPISPRSASLNQVQAQAQQQADGSESTSADHYVNGGTAPSPVAGPSSAPYGLGSAFELAPSASTSTSANSSRDPSVILAPSRDGERSTVKPPRTVRIPSRHLLQSALDLAQQAVLMDQDNDVHGALAAYQEAVTRLKAVMQRVAADAEREGSKRRKSGKAEEEGRTLQGIHDAYVARIQLLSSYISPPVVDPYSARTDYMAGEPYPGESTLTLVPHSQPRNPTNGSSAQAFELGPPISSHTSPEQAVSAGTTPNNADSQTNLGHGHPSSPASRIKHSGRPGTAGSGTSTPSRQLRVRNQSMSIGLEDEAGLTEADGLVDYQARSMEEQDRDVGEETLASPLPTSSSVSSGKGATSRGHGRTGSLGRLGQLISATTNSGTISQRRNRTSSKFSVDSDRGDPRASPDTTSIPSSKSLAFPRSRRTDEPAVPPGAGHVRSRSVSQPSGRHEGFQGEMGDNVPPLPDLRKKASYTNMSRAGSIRSENLAPPSHGGYRTASSPGMLRLDTGSIASRSGISPSIHGSLLSPLPETQPVEVMHRPFHVLRILRSSMDPDGPGAYLTGSIHIPSAIWNPSAYTKTGIRLPPPKITAQDAKIRVIDSILLHLEIIRHTGALLLEGPREVNYGVAGVAAPRIGAQKCMAAGEEFAKVLEAFEEEMEIVHRALVKGGVVLGSWKGKKASNAMSWGSKMARSMDKMAGSKTYETPDKYVDILAALCSAIQVIDDHLYNFTGPCTPAYHALTEQGYRTIESRMLRAAEFVKVVVAPFVMDDFKQFFVSRLRDIWNGD